MAKLLKLRRGTTSQHSSFTGAEGEVTIDTDKEVAVVHDGSTAGGHPVAAEDMANVSSANIIGRLASGSIAHVKLAGDAVDGDNIADDSINSEHYVDGSIDHAHLSNDCIDGDNIQDDVINSEHYAAASIDHEHLANDCVDGDNIANDSINSEHYVDASIDHAHLSNDCIDGDNIQDDVINSEHIAAGAVDLEHMSANSVDSDQYVDGSIDLAHMSANSVDSDQYVDGSIDHVHLSNDCIDGDNIQDDVINSEHYAADSIDAEHYAPGSVDATAIADNAVTTTRINDDAVTYAKIQDVSATNRILGRDSSGAGIIEEIAPSAVRTMINVEDGATADQTGAEVLALINSSDIYTSSKIGRDAGDYITFTTDTQMDVYVNGNNEFRFEADGDFHADGDVIAYSTTTASDRRLKENIEVVPKALDKVQLLNGVTFDWKKNGEKSAGVIAQEVLEVLPEAVKEVTPLAGGDNYLTVNYHALTSILIESIKELKTELEELKGGN
jgi:hypothetical protein